jgi:DNA polymerase-1
VYVKDINAKNGNLRAFSERAAINAPLQGAAADIIKRAMVEVATMLSAQSPNSRMLLQVHDELVIEAPEQEAASLAQHIKKTMERVAQISVPLTVEVGVGKHWGEIH